LFARAKILNHNSFIQGKNVFFEQNCISFVEYSHSFFSVTTGVSRFAPTKSKPKSFEIPLSPSQFSPTGIEEAQEKDISVSF
jgi:hypothetical protein